jgi:hypothetical protein
MNKKPYVYGLKRIDGSIFYVGMGVGHRMYDHVTKLKKGLIDNPHKQNVMRKILDDGYSIGYIKIAEFDTKKDAAMYEFSLIFFMGEYLTNVAPGGELGRTGVPNSPLERKRLSDTRKGIKPMYLFAPGIQEKAIANRRGVKFTDQAKRNVSLAHIGLSYPPRSEESRQRSSQSLKGKNTGRIVTQETIDRITAKTRGLKRTPITIERMREARRKDWQKRKSTS